MKTSSWPVVRRILWPERASLFAIVGGAIGLMGDITGFFSEFISPVVLTAIFGVVALIASLLCLQRAFLVRADDTQAVEEVVRCRVCDAMRFSLFAFAAFLVLLAIGQDKSATEVIASKLGLIHEDVKQIGEDVGDIKSDVGDIREVTQSQQIIKDPQTGTDYFTNAWIYSYVQRDPAKAHESLEELYTKGSGKLDSAELYFETGRQIIGKTELLGKMERLGEDLGDPALLAVAARNAVTAEDMDRLVVSAQKADPSYPFAYWDVQRFASSVAQTGFTPAEQLAGLKKQIMAIEDFLQRIGEKPASAYFFLPQYQPDHEALARQTLASLQRSAQGLEQAQERLNEAVRKRDEMRAKINGN